MVYAGILKRFIALIVDSILVGVVSVPIMFGGMALLFAQPNEQPSEDAVALATFAMIGAIGLWVLFYMTWFVGRFGATPGKMLLGIKIVRSDGSPVSYLRAFARFWAHQLSANIMYIGFIIALFDEQRRGLHDHRALRAERHAEPAARRGTCEPTVHEPRAIGHDADGD